MEAKEIGKPTLLKYVILHQKYEENRFQECMVLAFVDIY